MKKITFNILRIHLGRTTEKNIYHSINAYFLGRFGSNEYHEIGFDLNCDKLFVVFDDQSDDASKVFDKLSSRGIEEDIKKIVGEIKSS